MSEQPSFTIKTIDEMIEGHENSIHSLKERLKDEKEQVKKTELRLAEVEQRLKDLEASRNILNSVYLAAKNVSTYGPSIEYKEYRK